MKQIFLNKNFTFMWFSNFTSILNGRFKELVIPLIVLGLTQSPIITSLVLLSQQLGTILFSIPIGTWVEQRNKVRIATVCHFIYAICIFTLSFLIFHGQYSSIYIALLLFIMGIVALISRTAFSAMIPNIAGRDRLLEAHTSLEAADAISTLVGPALGGFILAQTGSSFTLLVCGLLAIGSMIFIASVAHREEKKDNSNPSTNANGKVFIEQTKEGLNYLISNLKQIVNIIVMSCLAFSTVYIVLSVIFHAEIYLGLSEELIGILLSFAGVGNIIGILIMKWFKEINWLYFLSILLMISSVGVLILTFSGNFILLCLGMLIFDGALSMAFIVQGAVQQGVTPDELLSRIRSAIYVVGAVCSTLGTFLAGTIPEFFSSQLALFIGALVLLIPGILLLKFRNISGKLSEIKPDDIKKEEETTA